MGLKSFLLSTAFLAGLQGATALGFNSKGDQVVVYSNGATPGLSQICKDPNVDGVILSFVDHISGESVSADFGGTPSGADIKQCQSNGKTVLVSLGGETFQGSWNSAEEAQKSAQVLWDKYGAGKNGASAFDGVATNGFDLDFEKPLQNLDAFTEKLLDLKESVQNAYLTGAPQCVLPDANIGATLDKFWNRFDAIFVQFYNNKACGIPEAYDGAGSSDGSGSGSADIGSIPAGAVSTAAAIASNSAAPAWDAGSAPSSTAVVPGEWDAGAAPSSTAAAAGQWDAGAAPSSTAVAPGQWDAGAAPSSTAAAAGQWNAGAAPSSTAVAPGQWDAGAAPSSTAAAPGQWDANVLAGSNGPPARPSAQAALWARREAIPKRALNLNAWLNKGSQGSSQDSSQDLAGESSWGADRSPNAAEVGVGVGGAVDTSTPKSTAVANAASPTATIGADGMPTPVVGQAGSVATGSPSSPSSPSSSGGSISSGGSSSSGGGGGGSSGQGPKVFFGTPGSRTAIGRPDGGYSSPKLLAQTLKKFKAENANFGGVSIWSYQKASQNTEDSNFIGQVKKLLKQ